MLSKSITIDFNRRSNHPEILAHKAIRLPKPGKTTVLGVTLFDPRLKVNWYRLWVELDDCPETVRIDNLEYLFLIKSASRTAPSFENFTIEGTEFPFEVHFCPGQILDYHNFNNDRAEIRAFLKAQFKPDSEVQTIESFAIQLRFIKASPETEYEFQIDAGFRTGFEHRPHKRVLLGHFELKTRAPVLYSHSLDCRINVKFDETYRHDLVSFGDGRDIRQSRPISGLEGGGLREEGDALLPDAQITLDDENAKRILVENLLPENKITIPVYVDLVSLKSPYQPTEYSATVLLEMRLAGQEVIRSLSRPFRLLQDTRRAELKLLLREDDRVVALKNGKKRTLISDFQWRKGKRGKIRCFTLELGNYAESGNGIVCIRDCEINFGLAEGTTSQIQTVGNIDPGEIFTVNDHPVTELDRNYYFRNEVRSHKRLNFAFRHDQIEAIPEDIATFDCRIRFKYQELEQTPEHLETLNWAREGVKNFEARLSFNIQRNLGAYWLSIDFGTAATVTAFDEDIQDLNLINLQDQLRNWVSGENYNPVQIQEFNTSFLASNILLRYGGGITAPDYKDDVIYLSPPYAHAARDSDFAIPYLKSIIGLEEIPNPHGRLDGFKYKENASDDDQALISFEEAPLSTRTVLTNTYQILLRDFVKPVLESRKLVDKLNKVVITIPNTFTPRHTDFIRDLITREFPFLRKDYLTFVSESDAIAYFYLAKWNLINRDRDATRRDALRPGSEYVLVYDMGAGTLDLTYLCIETDNDDKKSVRILGRLGKSTAGNYLDYVIARYIHEHFNEKCVFPIFQKVTGEAKEAQVELKRLIRERIKPKLDEDIEIPLSQELEKFTFTEEVTLSTRELRESDLIGEFILHNTKHLFENFFTLFNTIDGHVYKKGSIPLDTVIFSGRSIQFGTLKQAAEAELQQWCNSSGIYYAYLGDASIGLNAATLKSAVVQGALEYALLYRDRANANISITNHNLMARYGVLYRDPRSSDTWRFKELLNPATRPVDETSPTYKDGMTIYTYDTDRYDADTGNDDRGNRVDLSGTPVGYFAQSYANDTEGDMNIGNQEYITLMNKFNPSDLPKSMLKKAKVRIFIDENNEMTTRVCNEDDDPKAPLRVDVDNSLTFRRSMWPYWDDPEANN